MDISFNYMVSIFLLEMGYTVNNLFYIHYPITGDIR